MFNVSLTDSGLYWCSATNHITSDTYVSEQFTKLFVQPKSKLRRSAPEFLVKPKPYFVVPKGN